MERLVIIVMGKWQERALISAQLQEEGYSVQSFPSFETATAFLCQTSSLPDGVILDSKGMTASADELRAFRLLLGDTPLVLCTAPYSRDREAEEALKPAEILVRPFTVKELVETVKRLIPPSAPIS
jgi:DNA-binding response OmpR family regulator